MPRRDAGKTVEMTPVRLDEAAAVPLSLLVVDGLSSALLRPLPDHDLVFGRDGDSDVVLRDSSVSRRHARIVFGETGAAVEDLGSQNGTTVNGEPIHGAHPLRAGDVVGLGEATVVVRFASRQKVRSEFEGLDSLTASLDREVERALAWDRPLAVVAVAFGEEPSSRAELALAASAALPETGEAGWDAEPRLLVVLPERGANGATAAARALLDRVAPLAPGARAGIAILPADGVDTATLLASARAASGAAEPGGISDADGAVVTHRFGERMLVVADEATHRLYELVRRLAVADIPVLVSGETGAGKENAALALHHWSPRARSRFVALNAAAVPETLLESELFGYEKGAFSGAAQAKPGLLEQASGGTMFLDEVGELSPAAQAKLLRALETKRVTRVGGLHERPADFRLVAASHRDLASDVGAGRFRKDLWFRLGEAVVALPPLRERPREMPVLARLFLSEALEKNRRGPATIGSGAMKRLVSYEWPGNVRELKNVIELVAATASGDVLEVEDLPDRFQAARVAIAAATPAGEAAGGSASGFRPIAAEIEELESRRIREALDATGGNQTRAAALIAMPRRTFLLKLKKYGVPARH